MGSLWTSWWWYRIDCMVMATSEKGPLQNRQVSWIWEIQSYCPVKRFWALCLFETCRGKLLKSLNCEVHLWWRKCFWRLPDALSANKVLTSETESAVAQIWRDLARCNFTCNDVNVSGDGIFKIAWEWVLLFLSLEDTRTGYERRRITPYIHILVYHILRICISQSQENPSRRRVC